MRQRRGPKNKNKPKKPRVASAWKEVKIYLERIALSIQSTVIYDTVVMNGRIRG